MTSSSICLALIGGALIGATASLLLLFNGRVLGVSGIMAEVVRSPLGAERWRIAFVLGLVAGGALLHIFGPPTMFEQLDRSPIALIASGLLVGFGTSLGSGCTSGHGICGVSRLSKRSILATVTFMAFGAFAVFIVNRWLGGRV